MQKRAIGWVLSGVFFATIGVVSAAGCSSPLGECENACYRVCEVREICEDNLGDFDAAQCRTDCPEYCDDEFDQKEAQCAGGVETNAKAVAACHESLDELTHACVDDNGGKVIENSIEVGINCAFEKGFNCQ